MARVRSKKSNEASSTSEKKKKIDRATFKYVFDESYNPVYANGAYGGVTPHGEVAISFFVERSPIPHEETFAISPDGRMGPQIERQPVNHDGTVTVIRYITSGVIMNHETAKRVYEFLGRQLENVEALKAAKQAAETPKGDE